ncbi:ribosomal subunit 39S-domain-containing protein [Rhexocercosporidium sp. MPI-PUGE-AT-0058]|nr:ribosomal subunit 39S-domain-containing protein [Rhexocercosporidium sp. MPI-PUGE-AT-0058]
MRRIARLDRSIDLLRTGATVQAPSTYLCTACKHHAAPFSTSVARDAKVSMTEKLRRKIWGTDSPPGLEDPYGDKSVFDQTKKRQREQQSEEQKAAARLRSQEFKANRPPKSEYKPATTWDGLRTLGHLEDRWANDFLYKPFVPMEVKKDSEEITAALHRAMVEIFALKEAGVSLKEVSNKMPGRDLTLDVTLGQSSSGPVLKFMGDAAPPLQDLVGSVTGQTQAQIKAVNETVEKTHPTESEEDVAADRSTVDPLHPDVEPAVEESFEKENPTESEEDLDADRTNEDPLHPGNSVQVTLEELIASWGPEWLQVSLEDPEIKFAVLKRMMQLSGIRIPDAHLKSSKTASSLLKLLIIPPKPRKLVDALSQKEDLVTLPNVSIYPNRITPVDKERSLGRWKVIEKELEERGLPVHGHEAKRAYI